MRAPAFPADRFPDRVTLCCLAALVLFGLLRLVGASPASFSSLEGTLAGYYFSFVPASQATYLYAPLFEISTSASFRHSTWCSSVLRRTSRQGAFRDIFGQTMAASCLFAVTVTLPSLLALATRSGLAAEALDLAVLGATHFVFDSLFFLVVGLTYQACWLLTSSTPLSLALAIVYGGFDSFISAFGGYHGDLWVGWMLTSYADPSRPLILLAGLVRILAVVVALLAFCLLLFRRLDFVEGSETRDL